MSDAPSQSGDPAYDRYREALREGHLASQRADHDRAIAAYREAARLASGRPVPLVGLGSALQAAGRHPEALDAFSRVLEIAPLDEAALRGRAASQVALGRNGEAAATLTGLADSLEADGRPRDALKVAREALALAAAPARFRLVARLSAAVTARVRQAATTAAPGATSASSLEPAPEPVPAVPPGIVFGAEADALVDDGRIDEARDRYLRAARAFQDEGRPLAALDACYSALAIAPADPDLHLALAGIYEARGWQGPAVEKLMLLARLLDLAGDGEARRRLCAVIAERYPDEPRLAGLCP